MKVKYMRAKSVKRHVIQLSSNRESVGNNFKPFSIYSMLAFIEIETNIHVLNVYILFYLYVTTFHNLYLKTGTNARKFESIHKNMRA